MFPFGSAIEIDIATLVVIAGIAVALSLQLVLCFRASNLFVRLTPLILFLILAIVFSILSACTGGWDGIGYLFFALLFAGLLLVCGLGWGLWAIIRTQHP